MSQSRIDGVRIAGVSTCVPPRIIDNLEYGARYGAADVRKVVSMAGVKARRVVDPGVTATDLCFEAASRLLDKLGWSADSITGLILVTQSPDYFLPSSSCLAHKWLGLKDTCAAFDVGLGCSGYPYGLYLASSMLKAGGQQRILMLTGDTPSLFTDPNDHATTLLFGDAGTATALELSSDAAPGYYSLHTDGRGYEGLILRGGGYRNRFPADPRDLCLSMDGAGVFAFTIERVPPLVLGTLEFAGLAASDVDQYFFHQSNQFMMRHLIKKCGVTEDRVPLVLDRYGNAGGASVALAITQGMHRPSGDVRGMMVGYGVGLSWGSAIVTIDRNAVLLHADYTGGIPRA
jgi:3-oxoacyl-[acyl-carrier-protein] synthase III